MWEKWILVENFFFITALLVSARRAEGLCIVLLTAALSWLAKWTRAGQGNRAILFIQLIRVVGQKDLILHNIYRKRRTTSGSCKGANFRVCLCLCKGMHSSKVQSITMTIHAISRKEGISIPSQHFLYPSLHHVVLAIAVVGQQTSFSGKLEEKKDSSCLCGKVVFVAYSCAQGE